MAEKKPFLRQVTDQALDAETARQIAEQKMALEQHPEWAEGYYHLAQLYRVQHRDRDAKEQLLIALEKKQLLPEAHIALGELYISEGDLKRAQEQAEIAASLGHSRLLEQMRRHNALTSDTAPESGSG